MTLNASENDAAPDRSTRRAIRGFFSLVRLFDLRPSQGEADVIDAAIRNGARFGGANLWVLFFAILIASVGLNVNSTSVIIGAMLISPLMGPIVGMGYGAGVNDSPLIRRSATSFFYFVLISLVTATAYFMLSPLDKAQSELLARTSPSLWDVLIAFFGGSAGIIAITRREVSTVVPGVAIATALMPPLCTAGYGLATGNLAYFAGAFYLFTINAMVIAASTLLFVKLLRLPSRGEGSERSRGRTRLWVAAAVLIAVVPSAYLTLQLLRNEVFQNTVGRVLEITGTSGEFVVVSSRVDAARRSVDVVLGGDHAGKDVAGQITRGLAAMGVADAKVSVRYLGSEQVDLSSLRRELQEDVYRRTLDQLNAQTTKAQELQKRIDALDESARRQRDLVGEIRILFPEAVNITLGRGISHAAGIDGEAAGIADVVHVTIGTTQPEFPKERLEAWLATRFPDEQVLVDLLDVQSSTGNPASAAADKIGDRQRAKPK